MSLTRPKTTKEQIEPCDNKINKKLNSIVTVYLPGSRLPVHTDQQAHLENLNIKAQGWERELTGLAQATHTLHAGDPALDPQEMDPEHCQE